MSVVAHGSKKIAFLLCLGYESKQPPHSLLIHKQNKAARYGTAHVENVLGIILALCPL